MMGRLVLAAFLFFSFSALAEIKHYPDPVYQKLSAEDSHPMDEIVRLAEEGDPRAQFILGDLHAKGKGGMPKNIKKARAWFEQAAMEGYAESFIRLAALSKREKKPLEAYQWYTLAYENLGAGGHRDYAGKMRGALAASEKMTETDFKVARKAVQKWREKRDEYKLEQRRKAHEKEKLKQQEKKHEQD